MTRCRQQQPQTWVNNQRTNVLTKSNPQSSKFLLKRKAVNMNVIANIILSLTSIILTSVIIPYIREKTTAEQKKRIKSLVQIAVTAAEQIIQGKDKGNERFRYVMNCLKSEKEKCRIKLDDTELKSMIESEVYCLKNFSETRDFIGV